MYKSHAVFRIKADVCKTEHGQVQLQWVHGFYSECFQLQLS